MEKKKNFFDKIKAICSITVKDEGKALNVIFVLCLISIIAFSVFLYRTFTHFYVHLDETMHNNVNMNIEVLRNEHIDYVEDILNNKLYN